MATESTENTNNMPSCLSTATEAKPDLRFLSSVRPYMESAISNEDWNRRVDDVLAANHNQYPPFWKELMGDGAGYPSANGSLLYRLQQEWERKSKE